MAKQGDLKGAWVGWNNLGELLWKIGEYRASAFHLQKALEVAENPSMRLETLRNFLELHLRTKGPFAPEVDRLIEELGITHTEPYEQMQLLNSLSYAHLLRGENELANQALEAVIPLTSPNPLMHMYTLTNQYLLNGREEDKTALLHFGKTHGHHLPLKVMQEAMTLFETTQGQHARSPATFT